MNVAKTSNFLLRIDYQKAFSIQNNLMQLKSQLAPLIHFLSQTHQYTEHVECFTNNLVCPPHDLNLGWRFQNNLFCRCWCVAHRGAQKNLTKLSRCLAIRKKYPPAEGYAKKQSVVRK